MGRLRLAVAAAMATAALGTTLAVTGAAASPNPAPARAHVSAFQPDCQDGESMFDGTHYYICIFGAWQLIH